MWKIGEPLEEMMVKGENDLVEREESWRDLKEEMRRERERGGVGWLVKKF